MLHLIIGMPSSGKSTYIAALRHLLVADEVPTELELTGLADDETHLNRLEKEWLACEPVQRTKPATEGWAQFHIKDRATAVESELSIPDLRGEAFEQPACIGQCRTELLTALSECDGMLLFTNADREDDIIMLDDLMDLFVKPDEIGATSANAEPTEASGPEIASIPATVLAPGISFQPENMPEEVKIIEFLQVANRRPRFPIRRRIAVLISAWDIIDENGGVEPEGWFSANRPLLAQFLETNSDIWQVKIYGVSAQGGRLPQEKAALEKIKNPSKRMRIVGAAASEHDLSAPLRWLMSPGGERNVS